VKTDKIIKIELEGEDLKTFEDIYTIVNNFFSSCATTNTSSSRLIEQSRIKNNEVKILSLLADIRRMI
jgi:flagellar basal body P-ring protein FlgI